MNAIRPAPVLLAAVLTLAACPQEPVQVQIVHRCGDLNFTDLAGPFGRLQGENSVNSKFRVMFSSESGKITGKFVFGSSESVAMTGEPAGHEQMTFTAAGSGKRRHAAASITEDCRLQLVPGWVDGGTVTADPGEPLRFVPLGELKSMDFEPCTELLYAFEGAQNRSRAKPPTPGNMPSTRRSSMPVGAWSKKADFPSGCSPIFDFYIDGEPDAYNVATVTEKGEDLSWGMDLENSFIGLHSYSLHRYAKCEGGERRLLGVACMQMEIK